MATNTITPKEFDNIGRGTSVTIPVIIKRLDETPFDLTGYQVVFTMKELQWDYDYDDARACIQKEVPIGTPLSGSFYVQLTSEDTWLTPGTFYFDIELIKDGAVARIALFNCTLVGGPTNRTINTSDTPIILSSAVSITFTETSPIVLVTPLISDPPENLIETVIAEPAYLLEAFDDPIRNIKIKSYAPQVSLNMVFDDLRDSFPHLYPFEEFSFPNLPEDCPLHGGALQVKDRELFIQIAEEMEMDIFESYIQHSPQIVVDGSHTRQSSSVPYYVADNVSHGSLNINLYSNNQRQISIIGNYTMPRTLNEPSCWVFRIDYFNWN